MLFINANTSAKGAKDYFRAQLSREDYYLRESHEITGQWHGRGAALLGLSGKVDRESYFRLCDNLHPGTAKQLTARTNAKRRILYDFTFDLPKGASLAYELGGDERILDAFRASVQETMAEIENAMCVRVRKGGQSHDRISGNIVWAEFVHRTTRPMGDGVPDPQTHMHAVVFNASYDAVEEKWKAGEFSRIKSDAAYYQSAFHARLAGRLSGLGYGIEKDGKSFSLVGIDKELSSKYSRRSQLIDAEAKKRGITDLKQKSELGKMTRQAKGEQPADMDDLKAAWNARLTQTEALAIRDAVSGASRDKGNRVTAQQAIDHAIEHSFERASVITEKQLLANALVHGVGSVTVEDVHAQARRSNLIRREYEGKAYVTTKEVYQEELDMLRFARDGRGQCRKLGRAQALPGGLSREQQDAARYILNSRDRATGLRGGAGTGKTRMMQATVAAIEASGQTKVFTFAPSAEASRGVLRSEGFEDAETVERLLKDKQLQGQVRGQVLWVDEAGLLSSRDMRRLFKLAEAQDCRVILSGDSKQHSSVIRGDALRLLEKEAGLGFAELKQVRRQTNEAYRRAVSDIALGDERVSGRTGKTHLERGIEKLDAMGAIVELEGEDRYRQIAADYLAAVSERKADGAFKTALVVSPTHAEGDRITQQIRDGLKAEGRITGKERTIEILYSRNWTVAERKDASNYHAGQVVQLHQNVKGFKRGEKLAVVGPAESGKGKSGGSESGEVRVVRADNTVTTLPLSQAEHFQVYERGSLALAAGDRIRITQNGFAARKGGPDYRLNNGSIHEVAGFTRAGDITLASGAMLRKDGGHHITHGYTSTSHASQGKTVDKVFIGMGSESLAAANREQFYVSVRRGRESVRLYTEDKGAMKEAVRASGARLSATELLKDKPPLPKRSRVHRIGEYLQINRLQRAYAALRERVTGQRRGRDYEQRF